jgi:hypothetical protein
MGGANVNNISEIVMQIAQPRRLLRAHLADSPLRISLVVPDNLLLMLILISSALK